MTADQPGFIAHQVFGGIAAVVFLVVVLAVLWYGAMFVIAIAGAAGRLRRPDSRAAMRKELAEFRTDFAEARRRAKARGKRRVRLAGFDKWPSVYRTGGRDDAPQILLEARYASPASMKVAKVWAVIAAVLFGFWLANRLSLSERAAEGGWIGAVLWGALASLLSFFVWLALFRRTLWRFSMLPLRMTFWQGGIEWKGEAQARKRFGFGGADLVKPGEKWNPEVRPHRLAAQELRENQKRQQQGLKPKRMYYQQCSEVVIFAGPGLPRTLTVAELAEDEQGDKARALVAAIIAAFGLSIGAGPEHGLVDTAQPVEEPDALPAPATRRRGLRR